MVASGALNSRDGRSKKRPGLEGQTKTIVAAAVDLFIERGSAAVSISEICAQADIGRQTFYRCFDDKDALIEHLYQETVNEHIERALDQMPSALADGEWAYDLIDQVIDAILRNERIAQLLFVEASNPNSPAFQVVDAAMERAAKGIQKWSMIRVGKRPSRVYVKSLLAATTWLVHNAIRSGRTKASVREAKRASRLLFEGMYCSLRTAA